jgi:hypothetical protein
LQAAFESQLGQHALGRVLGTLHGELVPLMPWLWLGQWPHAGKNATMGMDANELRC